MEPMESMMNALKVVDGADEAPNLTNLPTVIIDIVVSHLDTARSLAHLAETCKFLHRFVSEEGWRVFVLSHFNTFTLPSVLSADEWRAYAQSLTSQSRDWDRRALIVESVMPPKKYQKLLAERERSQTIPGNVIIDAHRRHRGNDIQDLIVGGRGEKLFGLVLHHKGPKAPTDEYLLSKDELSRYSPGKDDITCVSILKDSKYNFGQEDEPQMLVGRASGGLRLLSIGAETFGNDLLTFCRDTGWGNDTLKSGIQSLDINYKRGLLAAATRQGVYTYSLLGDQQVAQSETGVDDSQPEEPPQIWADGFTNLKTDEEKLGAFDYIRSVKFVKEDTLAVGLNKAHNSLRYLTYRPSVIEISHPPKTSSSGHTTDDEKLETVRAILPIDASSLASGGGNAFLSSWDDGTIRLKDLRTPSPVDKIYQDNFEVQTPINALLSRGLERFIAGSGRNSVIKVFDYRWPKGYYHTDAIPCGSDVPYPEPPHMGVVEKLPFTDDRAACDYEHGRRCRWHTLSRHELYRPNFNMWLPTPRHTHVSPIYSLASPSDGSPSVFAGLAARVVEIKPRNSPVPSAQPLASPSQYLSHGRVTETVSFIETGCGHGVEGEAISQAMPILHQQATSHVMEISRKFLGPGKDWTRHRLDESIQIGEYGALPIR
ncbi:hypothetical protein F4804DRAFT_317994 [Jackrogersella minutella]|nr:hypothetical protein F4804DRAFT_317994 [Jackrogersella minutella]